MKNSTKPPKKLDTHMSNEKKQMLNQYLDEKLPECTVNWEEFKTLLQTLRNILLVKK